MDFSDKIGVPSKRSKYGNKKTEVDGITFDSKAEARRYGELKLLERAGEIRSLELQPSFALEVNGVHVCRYIGDFRYVDMRDSSIVVEDVKGVETKEFRIKKKLMQAIHGISVTLIH